jgi:hypothetical protein
MKAITGLAGGLFAAMLGGGKEFGRQYLERFSSTAIEDVVAAEGGAMGVFGPSKKERCWQKYKDLAQDFATADSIDRAIKEALGRFVETRVAGARG